MPRAKNGELTGPTRAPAGSPDQWNDRLIAKSYAAAEEIIDSGKATSQLLTHFLKQGTVRDELEKVKLQHEIAHLEARTAAEAGREDQRELYEQVIRAMVEYKGEDPDE